MSMYEIAAPIPFGFRDSTVIQRGAPARQAHRFLDIWDTWVRFPTHPPRPAPKVQGQVTSILEFTGWSTRALADCLGTTHPTVSAIAAGRSSSFTRIPALPSRIAELYGLLERLSVVAEHDRVELNRLLDTHPSEGQPTAREHLLAGDVTGAWLSAIDVANPRRTGPMMMSRFPARAGTATTTVDE